VAAGRQSRRDDARRHRLRRGGLDLLEYWIHRLVFHDWPAFKIMHNVHNAYPTGWVGIAPWGTFAGFGVLTLIFVSLAGVAGACSLTAGVMLGSSSTACSTSGCMATDRAFRTARPGGPLRRRRQRPRAPPRKRSGRRVSARLDRSCGRRREKRAAPCSGCVWSSSDNILDCISNRCL
jgi:hypothetical protein